LTIFDANDLAIFSIHPGPDGPLDNPRRWHVVTSQILHDIDGQAVRYPDFLIRLRGPLRTASPLPLAASSASKLAH